MMQESGVYLKYIKGEIFRLMHPMFFEIICLVENNFVIVKMKHFILVGFGKFKEHNTDTGIQLIFNLEDHPLFVKSNNDFWFGVANFEINVDLGSAASNIDSIDLKNPFKEQKD